MLSSGLLFSPPQSLSAYDVYVPQMVQFLLSLLLLVMCLYYVVAQRRRARQEQEDFLNELALDEAMDTADPLLLTEDEEDGYVTDY